MGGDVILREKPDYRGRVVVIICIFAFVLMIVSGSLCSYFKIMWPVWIGVFSVIIAVGALWYYLPYVLGKEKIIGSEQFPTDVTKNPWDEETTD